MKITVKLHAHLRRHLPLEAKGTAVLEMPDGATVADVIERLEIPANHAKMMVVDDEYLEESSVLCDGQELNLFPPLAGG